MTSPQARKSPAATGLIQNNFRSQNTATTDPVQPKLTGNRCQCPTCGEYFNSTWAFDAHRYGPYDGKHHCQTPDEMAAVGWFQNGKGFWVARAKAKPGARRVIAAPEGARKQQAMQPQGGAA